MKLSELYQIYLQSKGVTIDTRQLKKGMIFFGLTGRHHDGGEFAEEALRKGASLVICQKSPYQRASKKIFVSKNPLKVLQKLASYHRRQLENTHVLAITGSNGKTTTRSLCHALLSTQYKTVSTQKNYNNHIGVPLTLLSASQDTEILIVELGANSPGEIQQLCQMVLPDYGVVTNVGKDHLAGFGSEKGVRAANAELYDHLADHGKVAFVDAKEDHLLQLSVSVFDKIFYNQKINQELNSLECHIKKVTETPYLEFDIVKEKKSTHIKTSFFGRYNIKNVVTAITIAEYFNIPLSDIVTSLQQFEPVENRSQILELGGHSVLLDAYNANPSSMHSVLDSVENLDYPSKLLILGEMKELGPYSPSEHQSLLDRAAAIPQAICWAVGREYQYIDIPESVRHYDHVHLITSADIEALEAGTLILLKGSRSVQLEKILDLLVSP